MFFTYASHLPRGVGFSLFSAPHLCTLAAILLFCLFGARWYKKLPDRKRRRCARTLGLLLFLADMLRYAVYWRMGGLSIYELPLHLCGLAVYLCILHSLWKPDWLSQTLYTLCLPGACCALVFPDWTMYPFFSFVSLHSFLAHALLVYILWHKLPSVRLYRGCPPFGSRSCFCASSSRPYTGLTHSFTPITCFYNCRLPVLRS